MDPLSTSLRKSIAALAKAKNRRETGLFVAEGTKCVLDTIDAFTLRHLVATAEWIDAHAGRVADADIVCAKKADMERMSSMSTAPSVLAVYEIPAEEPLEVVPGRLALALDCVQDPGNLGTIVRAADWFGVDTIYASTDTADIYSAKAVQATMGAISRVRVQYCDLDSFLRGVPADVPVFGTFLGGENIYTAPGLDSGGILVLGNEGRGISPLVAEACTRRLTIPSYPAGRPTSESLNVGVAAAVALSAFRSKTYNTNTQSPTM